MRCSTFQMMKRSRTALAAIVLMSSLLTISCTGGTESNAAEEKQPPREAPVAPQQETNAIAAINQINSAIPIYEGAQFRDDLTRRDEVMIRNRYGSDAAVYTLATDDSFPQVYHYYTTYLAQFRAFPAQDTYPPEQKNWRTLEVQLNQAMQDPFIPGEAMSLVGKQVTLQVAETEAEPRTVIRYIVTPTAPAAPAASPTSTPTAPVAR
jgi:hypothetical protein